MATLHMGQLAHLIGSPLRARAATHAGRYISIRFTDYARTVTIAPHLSVVLCSTDRGDGMTVDKDDIFRRAMAAHFRSGGTEQPSGSSSGVEKIGGKWYAVLRNVRGIMAVYRVRNDGKLKKLIRFPAGLE